MTASKTPGVRLRYGIPDVEIGSPKGGTVNPATFVGHLLAVVFLPSRQVSAERETEAYCQHASAFSQNDAWLLFVAPDATPSEAVLARCHGIGVDPDGDAWRAFLGLISEKSNRAREEGGVFLFSRGGGLEKAWFGPGHAEDVVREMDRPGDW